MKNTLRILQKDEQGFTLVELAVVMVIIGVLIGGILKGQELITNARVTSTISQFQALSAAKNDFQNQYNAIPGDMVSPATRLSNCGGSSVNQACTSGEDVTAGNGRIDVGAGVGSDEGEGIAFYGQLLAADYITGITGDTSPVGFGTTIPLAPLGGGFYAGDANGAVGFGSYLRSGLYVTLVGSLAPVGAATGLVTGTQSARMDTKLDDGVANGGTFFGNNDASCHTAGVYANTVTSVCSLAYRIQ